MNTSADTGMSPERLRRWFVGSAAVVLGVTAMLKLAAASGDARILSQADPLLGFLSNREMMLLSAVIEVIVVGLLLREKNVFRRLALVAWIGGVILAYRVGLWGIGYSGPCSCLGHVTDALGISATSADLASKLILGYLLLGSYTLLTLAVIARWNLGGAVSATSTTG